MINGWLKFKQERLALRNKEAAKGKIRVDRLEAKITKAIFKRAAQREERELRALEKKQAATKPAPVKAVIPPDLLLLTAEGHLPGFVVPSNLHPPDPAVNYAEKLEERYHLHLPEGLLSTLINQEHEESR